MTNLENPKDMHLAYFDKKLIITLFLKFKSYHNGYREKRCLGYTKV